MPNMTFRAGCQIKRMALEIGTLSLPQTCQHLPRDLSLEPGYVWAFGP